MLSGVEDGTVGVSLITDFSVVKTSAITGEGLGFGGFSVVESPDK